MSARPQDRHVPVMPAEVLDIIFEGAPGTIVDATFGAGGHSRALLENSDARVFGIDRDPDAVETGRALAEEFSGRFTMLEGRFSEMEALLAEVGVVAIDVALFDVGVSSMHLDEAERGFSFAKDGPLDMRMSQEGESAADFLNTAARDEIEQVLRDYGEEPRARRIARAITEARETAPFARTVQLADLVRRVVGQGRPGHHPATRTFQALRIYINRELDELRAGLAAAERLLVAGGRLVVITFHSLEDAIVKKFLALRGGRSAPPRGSRHLPDAGAPKMPPPSFRLLFKKPLQPRDQERAANPRSRSAKLRAAERTAAAAWPEGAAV